MRALGRDRIPGRLSARLKPAKGFSHYFHFGLTSFLPVILLVLVQIDLTFVAFLVILLSKWRMFVVKPRFWLANLRANAVDLMVGFSFLTFMNISHSNSWRLGWAAAYMAWLLFLKPGSNMFLVSLQAFFGQTLALTAIFLGWPNAPLAGLVISSWAIGYLSARHFLSSFDEPYSPLYASLWGYFAGALTWVLAHWLLFYSAVAQPTLLLTVLGFGLAGMYYLDENDKLSDLLRRQFIFIMVAVIVVVFVFSNWGDRTI